MADPKGPQHLILSLHIPKTGGTSFAAVLEQAFPGGVAYFYKPGNKHTHPMLTDRQTIGDPDLLRRLEETGIKVMHGHGPAAWFREAIPDTRRYWTWVRDPVERVISNYYYLQKRNERLAAKPAEERPRDKIGGRSLDEFVRRRPNRDQQSRTLEGVPLEAFGFVGVTERFEESLALLGLPPLAKEKSRNVNAARPEVDPAVRQLIRSMNENDVALYERALELHEKRRAAAAA